MIAEAVVQAPTAETTEPIKDDPLELAWIKAQKAAYGLLLAKERTYFRSVADYRALHALATSFTQSNPPKWRRCALALRAIVVAWKALGHGTITLPEGKAASLAQRAINAACLASPGWRAMVANLMLEAWKTDGGFATRLDADWNNSHDSFSNYFSAHSTTGMFADIARQARISWPLTDSRPRFSRDGCESRYLFDLAKVLDAYSDHDDHGNAASVLGLAFDIAKSPFLLARSKPPLTPSADVLIQIRHLASWCHDNAKHEPYSSSRSADIIEQRIRGRARWSKLIQLTHCGYSAPLQRDPGTPQTNGDDVSATTDPTVAQGAPGLLITSEGAAATNNRLTHPSPAEYTLSRHSEHWVVSWKGISHVIRRTHGMDYIATLIHADGQPRSCIDLRRGVYPAMGSSVQASDVFQGSEEGAKFGISSDSRGSALEGADKQALLRMDTEIRTLNADIAKAERINDETALRQLNKEKEYCLNYLRSNKNLHGMARASGNEVQNARKAVAIAVSRAIKSLRKDLPELARHLDMSVTTGKDCVYRQEPGIKWTVTF